MGFSPKTGRDLGALQSGMARWLSQHFGRDIEISSIETPKYGLSNETLMIDAQFSGGRTQSFVARLPPPDEGLFPEYELEKQAKVQTILNDCGIPAVRAIAYEADSSWIGAPFLLMPKIDGRPTDETPSYAEAGWLFELPASDQSIVLQNFMSVMSDIHRLDWRKAGLEIAARKPGSTNHLRDDVQWWGDYLKWVRDPEFPDTLHEVDKALTWCQQNWPDRLPPDSLVWGDARTGNLLFKGLDVAAVLDFENMSIGPAETDFGWWMAFRRTMFTGSEKTLPELPGYPDAGQSVDLYGATLGRSLHDVRWFEVFGAARIGAAGYGVKKTLRQRKFFDDSIRFPPLIPEWTKAAMGGAKRY